MCNEFLVFEMKKAGEKKNVKEIFSRAVHKRRPRGYSSRKIGFEEGGRRTNKSIQNAKKIRYKFHIFSPFSCYLKFPPFL